MKNCVHISCGYCAIVTVFLSLLSSSLFVFDLMSSFTCICIKFQCKINHCTVCVMAISSWYEDLSHNDAVLGTPSALDVAAEGVELDLEASERSGEKRQRRDVLRLVE